jgi:ubiquinone/menaquinone biosynthesis C-methylase UbiE
MRRRPTEELLDLDAGTPEEISDSLTDLRHINSWFGGVATTRKMIERVAARTSLRQLSLLEVAAGSGDLPDLVSKQLSNRGICIRTTLLDRSLTHLPNTSKLQSVAGDVFSLPFDANSFDMVSSSLFAHHLAPDQIGEFLGEALRVCRHAVLINDLIRHPLHLALVYAGLPLFRSPITWHDAPASVRQAYTVEEMADYLKTARSAGFELNRYFLFRMGAILWKQ